MARKITRRFVALRTEFKAACAAENAPCWLDGLPIDYAAAFDDYGNDDRFELDHYFPVSTHPELQEDPANFRASHAGCNNARSNGEPLLELGVPSREWF